MDKDIIQQFTLELELTWEAYNAKGEETRKNRNPFEQLIVYIDIRSNKDVQLIIHSNIFQVQHDIA